MADCGAASSPDTWKLLSTVSYFSTPSDFVTALRKQTVHKTRLTSSTTSTNRNHHDATGETKNDPSSHRIEAVNLAHNVPTLYTCIGVALDIHYLSAPASQQAQIPALTKLLNLTNLAPSTRKSDPPALCKLHAVLHIRKRTDAKFMSRSTPRTPRKRSVGVSADSTQDLSVCHVDFFVKPAHTGQAQNNIFTRSFLVGYLLIRACKQRQGGFFSSSTLRTVWPITFFLAASGTFGARTWVP